MPSLRPRSRERIADSIIVPNKRQCAALVRLNKASSPKWTTEEEAERRQNLVSLFNWLLTLKVLQSIANDRSIPRSLALTVNDYIKVKFDYNVYDVDVESAHFKNDISADVEQAFVPIYSSALISILKVCQAASDDPAQVGDFFEDPNGFTKHFSVDTLTNFALDAEVVNNKFHKHFMDFLLEFYRPVVKKKKARLEDTLVQVDSMPGQLLPSNEDGTDCVVSRDDPRHGGGGPSDTRRSSCVSDSPANKWREKPQKPDSETVVESWSTQSGNEAGLGHDKAASATKKKRKSSSAKATSAKKGDLDDGDLEWEEKEEEEGTKPRKRKRRKKNPTKSKSLGKSVERPVVDKEEWGKLETRQYPDGTHKYFALPNLREHDISFRNEHLRSLGGFLCRDTAIAMGKKYRAKALKAMGDKKKFGYTPEEKATIKAWCRETQRASDGTMFQGYSVVPSGSNWILYLRIGTKNVNAGTYKTKERGHFAGKLYLERCEVFMLGGEMTEIEAKEAAVREVRKAVPSTSDPDEKEEAFVKAQKELAAKMDSGAIQKHDEGVLDTEEADEIADVGGGLLESSYKDLTRVPLPPPTPPRRRTHGPVPPNFPLKLFLVLSTGLYPNIINWLDHGRSWMIFDIEAFEEEVLPTWFGNIGYKSFIDNVKNWSFRRVTYGPDAGSYYHERFLRGVPSLVERMKFQDRLVKSKQQLAKEKLPDFRGIAELSPLPKNTPHPLLVEAGMTTTEDAAAVAAELGDEYLQDVSMPVSPAVTGTTMNSGHAEHAIDSVASLFGSSESQDASMSTLYVASDQPLSFSNVYEDTDITQHEEV